MRRVRIALLVALGSFAAAAQSQDAGIYEIDAQRSEIHWLVYRAGTLARFGHNHVISVAELDGRVYVEPVVAASRFEMEIPVNALVVDDPELRAQKGEDFSSEPSESDITGTQRNMLSETVLNGAEFPVLRVSGTKLTGIGGDATLELTIEIRGLSVTHVVPVQVAIEQDSLTARGEFSLTHEDLGMEPFTVMLGALQVGERIDFSYRVHAERAAR